MLLYAALSVPVHFVFHYPALSHVPTIISLQQIVHQCRHIIR